MNSTAPGTGGIGFDASAAQPDGTGLNFADLLRFLLRFWLLLLLCPLLVGAAAIAYTSTLAPTFTATTTVLPPQQSQSSASAALASLGALAGLTGGLSGAQTTAEQYIALMQSATIADRIIDEFKLMEVYQAQMRGGARARLWASAHMAIGKRDGLISVAVDDSNPARAAAIANRFIVELRTMLATMALTEAQKRRVYFESLLGQTRDRLTLAQRALQASGDNAAALKTEPKSATEGYARMQAEVASAEVRLQTLRGNLTDSAPEVQQLQTTLKGLRGNLARLEQPASASAGNDFIGRYREYKYQETLFELYARQFEIARADEGREGTVIQVVDPATPPDLKSGPRRLAIATNLALIAEGALVVILLLWGALRRAPIAAGQSGVAQA